MKHTLMILAMLAACQTLQANAQGAPSTSTELPIQNAEPCLHVKRIHMNSNAVPQGGRIEVTIPLEATSCEVVYRQPERLPSPQGLVIDSPTLFRLYPGSTFNNDKRRGAGQGASGTAATSRKLEYHLVVEALPDAAVGKQDLVARVSYEALDKAGQQSPREQTLTIPITIVPAGTRVKAQHQPGSREKRDTIILIALAPLLVPLMLLGSIAYFVQHGQWPSS